MHPVRAGGEELGRCPGQMSAAWGRFGENCKRTDEPVDNGSVGKEGGGGGGRGGRGGGANK